MHMDVGAASHGHQCLPPTEQHPPPVELWGCHGFSKLFLLCKDSVGEDSVGAGGGCVGSCGSVAVQGEQSPHEAAGTLCLLRKTEPGWPHSADSVPLRSHTHQPLTPTPQGEGFVSPLLSNPLVGGHPVGWMPLHPQRCPLSAGISLPTRGAHRVSPRGCDTCRQSLQSSRCPRSGRESPSLGSWPVSTELWQHEGLGQGRSCCQRDPRRILGTGSLPTCATCGL